VITDRLRNGWNWAWSRFFRRLADAHRHFGNLYGNQMEHQSAVENYTRATNRDPTYAQAYYSRGVLYWREIGNHQQAIQDLTRVLELAPSWSEAYFNRGMAYKLHNEIDRALTDFERYLLEGSDIFWLESAERQVSELREDLVTGDEAAV
jgi:tetratricopeptide (TPR) repeat protein